MNEYTFELIFKLEHGEQSDQYLDAIYEAGCSDATILTGKVGYLGLSFFRKAKNAKNAIETAIVDVIKAIPHAHLEHAEPDLLNLSELAYLFGFSKQNMRKYARGEISSINKEFPSPVITGKTSYWHAAEIAQWLNEQGVRKINDSEIELLFTIWSLNHANELLHQPNPEMTRAFTRLLQSVA